MHPTIAVITRTHNRPMFLARALDAVSRQTYADIAHIVVNDAGDPEPVSRAIDALPQEARARIVRIDNETSSGREAAVNPGFAKARELGCRYAVVLDDDDTWAPDFLEKVSARLDGHPEEVAAVGAAEVVHERIEGDSIVEVSREPLASHLRQVVFSELLVRNYIPTVSLLFRTSVLDVLGGWRSDLPVLADWDFNLRLCMLGPIGFVDEPLARWHHRTTTDPDLGNSFVVASGDHRQYEGLIRDAYLRREAVRSADREPGEQAEAVESSLAVPLLFGGYAARLNTGVESVRDAQSKHLEVVKLELYSALDRAKESSEARLDAIIERQNDIDRHLSALGEQNALIVAQNELILDRLARLREAVDSLHPRAMLRRLGRRGGDRP